MFAGSGFAVWAFLATSTFAPAPHGERGIELLVEQLGAANFRTREAAHRELIALGDSARPVLEKASRETDSPEMERRIEVLISRLDRDRLHLPKCITLKGRYSIEELLEQITHQTGYPFSNVSNDGKLAMIVDWKQKSFWEAMDEIALVTGFSIQMSGDVDNSVSLYSNESFDPHVCRIGPFRMVATNIGLNINRQLSGLPRRSTPYVQYGGLNLNLMLFSEPKNPMLGAGAAIITRAMDDTGHDLVPSAESAGNFSHYYSSGAQKGNSIYLYANLARPGRDATMIKELRGKVRVNLLSTTRPELTIEPLSADPKRSYVSRTASLRIDELSAPNESGFTVKITASLLHPGTDDYGWSTALPQRLEISDHMGRKYRNTGPTAHHQAPGATSMTIQFVPPKNQKIGPPHKLVLVEWLTVQREIAFNFYRIPLP